MATVILARHGRTAANAAGVLAGRTEGVHLDEQGLRQVREAAERLTGVPIAAAVTSPLERCRETARELLRGRDLRATTDRRILECDYGEWSNRPIKELARQKLWRVVQSQPSAARFPGGESLREMSARAVAAVRAFDERLTSEHGPQAIGLVVSHGDPIKAVLADALGSHLDAFQRIVVHPASMSVVQFVPGRTFVLATNTIAGSLAHLAPPPRAGRRTRRAASADAVVGGGAGPETAAAGTR